VAVKTDEANQRAEAAADRCGQADS
jgi:hypothetical protein